ncbi:hypothetical protein CQA53_09495 [Helicobacter didelphidarum]|uniref:Uncharacterized protein n=1 Tax=Helicobacter didelphidarum TaxID=2040648 RepID=A0A3D8IAH8_9HELI|nr:hypothetical protein [Helicobacter didelphidarum]RDU62108.1 hypothetical protein CQA53_09495 [Helicobacter didelphidarum]
MGFKKLSEQNTIKNEEDFINNARGEINEQSPPKKTKRTKPFLINFTEEELNEIRNEANRVRMNVAQYIRFKVFNA